jgi:lysine 2,3-aminomutase
MDGLRGHTTGYAIPQYVIDAPGGGGKVPINPDYILSRNRDRVVIRNFEGKVFEYIEGANGPVYKASENFPVYKPSENFEVPEFY